MKDLYRENTIDNNDFKNYCETIIQQISTGKVTRQLGCYKIAGLMFREEVNNDPRLEDICLLAGELELPDAHTSGDIDTKWVELKELVKNL